MAPTKSPRSKPSATAPNMSSTTATESRKTTTATKAKTNRNEASDVGMNFPLAALLSPARDLASSWTVLICILIATGLFRWAVGIWGFSGFRKPPMYGDFEAQRHWIELTSHVPVSQWYFHDLEWWGLDYPFLTAYHSFVMGKIGNLIDPSWFALYTSRGLESQDLKVFMRATVIVSEYLIYIPAIILCVQRFAKPPASKPAPRKWESSVVALTAILMQPATILIDHGHFQYNTVMLGFVAAMTAAICYDSYAWACLWFVAALGFKQMALFYAPAVFAYLLGACMFPRIDIGRFLRIATATVLAFAVFVAPFLIGVLYETISGSSVNGSTTPIPAPVPNELVASWLDRLPGAITEIAPWSRPLLLQLAQSVHRIFPFSRGLFEDKVANIWCAIHSSGVYKLTHRADPTTMSRYALALTAASILLPCGIIFLRPHKPLFLWALASCSWGFFLCSYQVHEKNVLLPLLPMTLLLASPSFSSSSSSSEQGLLLDPPLRSWVGFANSLAVWTLFPLLERDGLRIPYAVLTLLWSWLLDLPPVSLAVYSCANVPKQPERNGEPRRLIPLMTKIVHFSIYALMVVWHIAKMTVPAPERFPDLYVVGNVCLGAAGFGVCYLWCLWNLLGRSGLLGGAFDGSAGQVKVKSL